MTGSFPSACRDNPHPHPNLPTPTQPHPTTKQPYGKQRNRNLCLAKVSYESLVSITT